MSCWAPGLSQNESEIELNSTLDVIQEGASSELDLEEAYQQLEGMKQRVLQMKSKIVRTLPTESDTDHVPADSDNVNLRDVQLETSRGFQQIEAVKSRLKETTEELSVVAARIEESRRCTEKLAQQLDEVPKWMEEQKHQVAKCLERHNELETSYCSDFDYSSHMRPFLMTLTNKYRTKVPLKCYKIEHRAVSSQLGRTRYFLRRSRELLMHALRKMEETLLSSNLPQELPFVLALPETPKVAEQVNEEDDPFQTKPPGSSGAKQQLGFEAPPVTKAHPIPTQ
ncbi:uncharacterized protein LOC110184782 [Drosophila serrata]|uniref:uncharacterized protein LOC110184782 n=1 Tax=Drosophila serrata TaxID=7274 RepID=UPI000A1D390C|nr:uncharacterized protein LOC110184782 [Drosophila serrata]